MAKRRPRANRPRRAGHRRQLLVYIDPIFIKALKREALERESSVSALVESAIKTWLGCGDASTKMPRQSPRRRDERGALLAELAGRYVWWSDAHQADPMRTVAQVMELGTYEDIRRLEAAFAPEELRDAMVRAPAGAIGPRSWDFWRGRLRFAGAAPIAESPPRRPFDG
jgi:hypothetical protein